MVELLFPPLTGMIYSLISGTFFALALLIWSVYSYNFELAFKAGIGLILLVIITWLQFKSLKQQLKKEKEMLKQLECKKEENS